jgi:hypothetical protein
MTMEMGNTRGEPVTDRSNPVTNRGNPVTGNVMAEIDRLVVAEDDAIDLPEGANSLDFLQAIYRDPRQPMLRRIKCAISALPFEMPKLAVSVLVEADGDFLQRLERAISRSAKIIEARPVQEAPPLIDHRPPVAQTDRRYRR